MQIRNLHIQMKNKEQKIKWNIRTNRQCSADTMPTAHTYIDIMYTQCWISVRCSTICSFSFIFTHFLSLVWMFLKEFIGLNRLWALENLWQVKQQKKKKCEKKHNSHVRCIHNCILKWAFVWVFSYPSSLLHLFQYNYFETELKSKRISCVNMRFICSFRFVITTYFRIYKMP